MSRKMSHGWSNRQQGGFRQAGRGRMVYQRPKKVDQTLTLAQAASMDYDVVSLCQDFTCLYRDERRAVNIVADNRGVSDLMLQDLGSFLSCQKCGRVNSQIFTYSLAK